MLLAVLPGATVLSTWLVAGNLRPGWSWRQGLLRVAALAGAYTVALSELLGLAQAITPLGLALGWLLPLLASWGLLARHLMSGGRVRFPWPELPAGWIDRLILVGIMVIVAVTALTAWLAPPNTWDSLNYHMPRVAEWAQNRSLRPFATGIEVQNNMTPGGELAVLQLYVLAGSDRLVNFPEWTSMVISLLGVSWMAQQLGGKPRAQLVAAAITASLPGGIVQASSTMTDYLLALWLVCVAAETLELMRGASPSTVVPWLGLAAAVSIVTKPTAFPYLAPFAVAVAILLIRRTGWVRTLAWAGLALLLAGGLVAGHVARTIEVYGQPIAPERLESHLNELITPAGVISNVLRNAGLHAGTPWPEVNRLVNRGITKVHQWIGLDVNDPRTSHLGEFYIRLPTAGDSGAANSAQAYLFLATGVMMLVSLRRTGRFLLVYALVVAMTFVAYSALFKWQIFAPRLHVPFFVLFSPVPAVVLEMALSGRVVQVVSIALLASSWLWLASVEERPLFPVSGYTPKPSLLHEPRENMYVRGPLMVSMQTAIPLIDAANCSTIGIALSGYAPEYYYWYMLGAPRSDLEIQWMVSGTPSSFLSDEDYQPCAVLCDPSCPDDWETMRGLPLVVDEPSLRLFLATAEPSGVP